MKILYLCPDSGIPVLGRKGASVHVRELIGAFRRAGHEVTLAAQVLNKSPWEKPAELDANVIQIRPSSKTIDSLGALKHFNALIGMENSLPGELRRMFYNIELAADLKKRFENDPPDFIYERASLYATAGVELARELNAPLIVELNAPLAAEQSVYRDMAFSALAAKAERWMLTNASAVVTVSSALREHVVALTVEPGRVHVIPNGVNPALFHPAAPDRNVRERFGLNRGPVIGFVGGLRAWHGVEMLPALLERLAARFSDVRLVIAGDGPLRVQLEQQLRERKLSSRVVITGLLAHEEIAPVIRHFDVGLAPYPQLDHAFYFSPLKVFEYMACGVPVVASAVGQITEVVCDGETGLLCPAGDFNALVSRCEQLLGDPGLRQKLGGAGAALVKSRFTWDHNTARVIELAKSLIAARKLFQQ